MAPTRRIQPEPQNLSRAAGPPAPASAAATAPPPGPFYQGDEPAPPAAESPLTAAVNEAALAPFNRETAAERIDVDAGLSADADVAGAAEATEGEHLDQAIARIRQIRKPLGTFSQKLALPERPGYKRHWFNDTAGRIAEAEANGWAFVLDRDKKPSRRCVGSGRDKGALYAYAMELPAVFWEEDMAARHTDAQARIDALKTSPFRAPQGASKPSDKGKFYDPSEHDAGPVQIVKKN